MDPRLAERMRPLQTDAWWHGPVETGADPGAIVTDADGNRWNLPGEPTVYLAGDPGLALLEAGRHEPRLGERPTAVWRFRVRLERSLDLRDADVRAALGLPRSETWPLDRERCRSLGSSLRRCGAQALLVPSAGLLDQPERHNLVVLVEGPMTDVDGPLVRLERTALLHDGTPSGVG